MKNRSSFWKSLLAVTLLVAPFLLLQLQPDFSSGTVRVRLGIDEATKVFGSLILFIALLRIISKIFHKRSFSWPQWFTSDRWGKIEEDGRITYGFALVMLLLGVFLAEQTMALDMLTRLGFYMMLAAGLNIAIGMAGLLVLGYAGFYMSGAYLYAITVSHWSFVSWWMMLVPAFILGAGIGWIVGLPSLKLRGDYLALVTLGFAEGLRELARNLTSWTGGDKGISIPWQSKFVNCAWLNSSQMAYFVTVLGVVATIVFAYRLYHSRIGRAWVAIREDELAASAMGVPVVQMKLLAFALSAGVAAVAGVIYTTYIGFVDPSLGVLEQSVLVLTMVILGGLGSISGALLGSALLFVIPEFLRFNLPQLADYRLFLFGAVMVVMMLGRPQGLLGSHRRKYEMMGEEET